VDLLDDAASGFFTDREAFCRHALLQGLDYHHAAGRGTLPAGLVEAIRTLNQPPIPWQAKLAEWIRERFALPERQRSHARPSRRQSATPEIARPRFVEPEAERASRTFGVVIDTSGSMERDVLGKALGAVVSYSMAQGVQQVRLVYCDAQPYDEGYVAIESLVTRVAVRGRGGTVLQPALTLLETRQDFPKDSPILLITDGQCEDQLEITRDHAFVLAPGRQLPFVTRKPVFHMT
jgi:predicted metal-dependent peptidase